MKIDIHVHTKKTKQGDAKTRKIDSQRFHEIVSSTDVKIVAITNHNVFDLPQYKEFLSEVGDDFQIWPGVELDVLENGRRGHLIVIVSPKYAEELGGIMASVSKGKTPDEFNITIDDVISNFDNLNPLYIAHYHQKKPDLSDTDIDKIIKKTKHKNRVLKEATNAISVGIFLSHGHSSIYGSDIQNWDEYRALSNGLPDLRLPVESFEQFCLLLDKDNVAIDSLLNKRYPEDITIKPFKGSEPLTLKVFDDINIFFGSKGTGKSDILTAIASHYEKKGIRAKKFESGSQKLHDVYDLSGKKLSINLDGHCIDYCHNEIDYIKKSQEVDVTGLSKYNRYFSKDLRSKKSKILTIKDFTKVNLQSIERNFNEVNNVHGKFAKFKNYLENNDSAEKIIEKKEFSALMKIIESILEDLDKKRLNGFTKHKASCLFNSLIDKVNAEIYRKTGTPTKPRGTGFQEYALNRIKLEISVKTILENINKEIVFPEKYIGDLGDKGDLFCKTEILIQDGSITDGDLKPLNNVKKKAQKEFSRILKDMSSEIYTHKLFEKIAELNALEGIATIPTILELLMFKKYFTIDNVSYEPSTGESSMILLHKELTQEKEVYILDEPEKSLGNEYINSVIVPLIKEKAKVGKKVFIATHDANIAVRTLPYNSVYRYHGQQGYKTYVGNPFSNHLVNIEDNKDKFDWKEVSMSTLEGGRSAFGERGQIYGNI